MMIILQTDRGNGFHNLNYENFSDAKSYKQAMMFLSDQASQWPSKYYQMENALFRLVVGMDHRDSKLHKINESTTFEEARNLIYKH